MTQITVTHIMHLISAGKKESHVQLKKLTAEQTLTSEINGHSKLNQTLALN